MGWVRGGAAPILDPGVPRDPSAFADPLPQALVLTAIVIGFGVLAFSVALIHRTHQATGTDDIDRLRTTDS
jgi:multicomponent Na+:H+ antiporter subunit C